jgi:hypothetical protein
MEYVLLSFARSLPFFEEETADVSAQVKEGKSGHFCDKKGLAGECPARVK